MTETTNKSINQSINQPTNQSSNRYWFMTKETLIGRTRNIQYPEILCATREQCGCAEPSDNPHCSHKPIPFVEPLQQNAKSGPGQLTYLSWLSVQCESIPHWFPRPQARSRVTWLTSWPCCQRAAQGYPHQSMSATFEDASLQNQTSLLECVPVQDECCCAKHPRDMFHLRHLEQIRTYSGCVGWTALLNCQTPCWMMTKSCHSKGRFLHRYSASQAFALPCPLTSPLVPQVPTPLSWHVLWVVQPHLNQHPIQLGHRLARAWRPW